MSTSVYTYKHCACNTSTSILYMFVHCACMYSSIHTVFMRVLLYIYTVHV